MSDDLPITNPEFRAPAKVTENLRDRGPVGRSSLTITPCWSR